MSTRMMAKCWPITGIGILAKSVLISLADQANDEGVCWPSIITICERVCASERAVQGAIRELLDAGFLHRETRAGRPTIYHLTPVKSAEVTPAENAPRRKCTPADSATRPPQILPLTPADSAGITVREPNTEPSIEIITPKPKSEPRKKTELDFSEWPSVPSPQVLSDWLKFRRDKRAPVTQTVINGFSKELHLAANAGYSTDDCLTECMVRGWQGFKLEWLQRANPHANYQRPHERQDTSAVGRVRAAIAADRAREGLDPLAVGRDGLDVRPQVGEQLRRGAGPGPSVGVVLEGDFSRAD